MHEPSLHSSSDSIVNLACFEVGGGFYALEVGYVREIVRMGEITPLPNSPSLIEGVVDLRGSIIPVLDLSRVLSRGRGDPDSDARIVILDYEDLALGLWVEAATEVLSLDASRLEAVPGLATGAGYDAVSSMVRRDGEAPVMVLSLDTLVECVYRSARSSDAAKEPA